MLNGLDYLLAALAALAAGAINAIAGGGTLITFPTLTFLGVPPVIANVTNTVALCPGYFGGTMAQWNDLKTQRQRLWLVIPAGIVGGVVGGYLLLQTGEKLFKELVPYLILLASGLLAIQGPVRAWLIRRMGEHHSRAAGKNLLAAGWAGLDLWRIFRRGTECDHPVCPGTDNGGYPHATQRAQAGGCLRCERGSGCFLHLFGQGAVAGCDCNGSRRIDRRDAGRTAGRTDPTLHTALDGSHHWCDHFHSLFCARVITRKTCILL